MGAEEAIRGTALKHGVEPGSCLPDFEFVTVEGVRKRLSDFRGRKNLVLILTGGHDEGLLEAVAQAYAEFEFHEAQVIAILKDDSEQVRRASGPQSRLFEVVVDSGSALHRRFGSGDSQGESGLAVYVTDRWAEVAFARRTILGDAVPDIAEILGWLEFVDHQCPECFPPERPR